MDPRVPLDLHHMHTPHHHRDQHEHALMANHAAAASVLRYSAHNPVNIDGWLAKEGKSLRARRARYVRLIGQTLSSYRTVNAAPSWHISIADAVIELGNHPRQIRVVLPHRTLSFTASSDASFRRWIVALRCASVDPDSLRVDDCYKIGRLVGEGMNGQVRLAHDTLTGDSVAVKTVPRLGRENETEFLAREVEIILAVSHPNIVRTIDVFVRKHRIHFVMEYLAGGELFNFIAGNEHFTETHAASVMLDLLRALSYLHSKGITHRDVKLENLLCASTTWPLNVKLADFGFANYVSTENEPTLSSFVGTPYYIAPEMLRADNHGRPVDIWASGVVLYILLSGKFPFGGKNESEYYQRVLSKHAYFPDEEWSNISEEAKQLVRGMLSKDPQNRFTAEQCLQHPWIKRADGVRDHAETDIFPGDNDSLVPDTALPSPVAFRDNREKKGKWRHLGMLNHSLTNPTDEMVAARKHHEKLGPKNGGRLEPSIRSPRSLKDITKGTTDGTDNSTVNRRPSLIRRILSSGKLSLDRYDGRFPSFRGATEDTTADEASATPRKTLSLFSRDGPLRRSFHRSGTEARIGDDGINFVNSQSQRLPPKVARERLRQQRQAEAARKGSRGTGRLHGRKPAAEEFGIRSGFHSSPRLQTHLPHPLSRKPFHATGRESATTSGTRWKAMGMGMGMGMGMRFPIIPLAHLEGDSPVSSADEDIVRRTVSADVTFGERQLGEEGSAKLELLSRPADLGPSRVTSYQWQGM